MIDRLSCFCFKKDSRKCLWSFHIPFNRAAAASFKSALPGEQKEKSRGLARSQKASLWRAKKKKQEHSPRLPICVSVTSNFFAPVEKHKMVSPLTVYKMTSWVFSLSLSLSLSFQSSGGGGGGAPSLSLLLVTLIEISSAT